MMISQKRQNSHRKYVGLGLFVLLMAVLLFYRSPIIQAQAPSGFTKIVSVTGTTYTDTSVTAGQVNQYTVTSTDTAGESGPSNIITATTPNTTGQHSNALTWTAPTSGETPTGYNVYRMTVTVPNQPTGLAVVSN